MLSELPTLAADIPVVTLLPGERFRTPIYVFPRLIANEPAISSAYRAKPKAQTKKIKMPLEKTHPKDARSQPGLQRLIASNKDKYGQPVSTWAAEYEEYLPPALLPVSVLHPLSTFKLIQDHVVPEMPRHRGNLPYPSGVWNLLGVFYR